MLPPHNPAAGHPSRTEEHLSVTQTVNVSLWLQRGISPFAKLSLSQSIGIQVSPFGGTYRLRTMWVA
jgi:hypothetical protein